MRLFKRVAPVENVVACHHMEGLLNRAADGQLRGLAKWYAWSHAKRCSGCLAFLRRLEATSLALRAARAASVSEDQLARLRSQVRELAEGRSEDSGEG